MIFVVIISNLFGFYIIIKFFNNIYLSFFPKNNKNYLKVCQKYFNVFLQFLSQVYVFHLYHFQFYQDKFLSYLEVSKFHF